MMDRAIRAPLAEDGESRTYVVKAWRVKLGDFVEEGDPVCDLSFEGSVVTVTSPARGDIQNINRVEGQQADAGYTLGYLALLEDQPPQNPKHSGSDSVGQKKQNKVESEGHSLSDDFSFSLVVKGLGIVCVSFLVGIFVHDYVPQFIARLFIIPLILGIGVALASFFPQHLKWYVKIAGYVGLFIVAWMFWLDIKSARLNDSFEDLLFGMRGVRAFEFNTVSCEGTLRSLDNIRYRYIFEQVLWDTAELNGELWSAQCFDDCFFEGQSRSASIQFRVRGNSAEFLKAALDIREHCEDESLAEAARLRGSN